MIDLVKAVNGLTYDRLSAFGIIDTRSRMPGCEPGEFNHVSPTRNYPQNFLHLWQDLMNTLRVHRMSCLSLSALCSADSRARGVLQFITKACGRTYLMPFLEATKGCWTNGSSSLAVLKR